MRQPSFCTRRKLKPNVTLLRSSGGQSRCFCVQWVFLLCTLDCASFAASTSLFTTPIVCLQSRTLLVLMGLLHPYRLCICPAYGQSEGSGVNEKDTAVVWTLCLLYNSILTPTSKSRTLPVQLHQQVLDQLINRIHACEWTHTAKQAHRSRYTLSTLLS